MGVQSPAPLTHSSHSLRLLRKEQKTDARDEWLNYLSTKPGQAQITFVASTPTISVAAHRGHSAAAEFHSVSRLRRAVLTF